MRNAGARQPGSVVLLPAGPVVAVGRARAPELRASADTWGKVEGSGECEEWETQEVLPRRQRGWSRRKFLEEAGGPGRRAGPSCWFGAT